jgi:hypothetical protein
MTDQQETPLPEELARLGRPQQVHPAAVTSLSLILLCTGVFLLLFASLCNEITELLSPRNLGDYRITTRDGRTVPIKHGVKDYSSLIASVVTRVTREIIPPLHSALEAGQTVTFGPFEVTREPIGYKGKILAWDDVSVVQVVFGNMGRRLRLRASGSLLPWCYCNLESFPNGILFPDLIRAVCPSRLLVPARA